MLHFNFCIKKLALINLISLKQKKDCRLAAIQYVYNNNVLIQD